MTRSIASARRAPTKKKGTRSLRDPSITRLSFTCYRLIRVEDPDPGEPPWCPIELIQTRNTMGAFMFQASPRSVRRAS
jgi:hypothetical protein